MEKAERQLEQFTTLIVMVISMTRASLILMKIPDALTITGLIKEFQSMTG
jgi:hypothetical protein